MRIGVFVGSLSPAWGGAYTFERSVMQSLAEVSTRHEFIVFHEGELPDYCPKGLSYVALPVAPGMDEFPLTWKKKVLRPLARGLGVLDLQNRMRATHHEINELNFMRDVRHPLNQAAIEHRVHLLWFTSMRLVSVQVPFMMTLWDLGHRQLPIFPELSISGATWDARERAYRGYLGRASHIIIGTESGKEDLAFHYSIPPEHVSVIPFAVPGTFAEAAQQPIAGKVTAPARPFLFYPAQFWPHKNHYLALRILKILREKHGRTLDLVLTGGDKGNLTYIRDQAREMGLAEQVHFAGFVEMDQLAHYYRKAECLIFPTFLGPDNIPPLEAFAAGCPVVASKIRGSDQQLGDAALLVDPTDEDAFAEAVLKVMTDQSLKQSLIEKGRRRAAELTPQAYIQKVVSAIDRLEPYRRCWSNDRLWQHL